MKEERKKFIKGLKVAGILAISGVMGEMYNNNLNVEKNNEIIKVEQNKLDEIKAELKEIDINSNSTDVINIADKYRKLLYLASKEYENTRNINDISNELKNLGDDVAKKMLESNSVKVPNNIQEDSKIKFIFSTYLLNNSENNIENMNINAIEIGDKDNETVYVVFNKENPIIYTTVTKQHNYKGEEKECVNTKFIDINKVSNKEKEIINFLAENERKPVKGQGKIPMSEDKANKIMPDVFSEIEAR